MLCTCAAVNSVVAAGADPLDPVPRPGIPGMVRPPEDGVGVGAVDDPPHPAIPRIAPTVTAPTQSDLVVISFPTSYVSAPSAPNRADDIAAHMANPVLSPNRENAISLVQSKQ